MIIGIKDYGNSNYFVPLASILYKFLISNIKKIVKKYGNIDYLVYVPSYKNLRKHNKDLIYGVKFNELAKLDLLIEPKEHQIKHGTDIKSRKVEDARYTIDSSYNIDGKTILLFDDVCTTGSTLHSAASTLKQNGANKVIGLVIFKQVLDQYVEKIKNFTETNPFNYQKWKYDVIQ
jgi:predicted amidophosphoribosyltransferase